MRRILYTSISLTMILALSACADSGQKSGSPSASPSASTSPTPSSLETAASLERELRSINEQYDKAILQQDAAAMERLYSEDARITESDGKVYTKAQMVARTRSGDTKFEVGRSEDVNVRVHGDTAILTGNWIQKGKTKGKPFAGTLRYTTVYVRNDAKWQIISDQVTPISR